MDQQQPLVCPSHATQYIVAVIIGILVGAGASFVYFKQALTKAESNSYQKGFGAAKKRVLESSLGSLIHQTEEMRTLSGTILAVDGNRITLHTQSIDPFEEPILADRVVIIADATKIFKLIQKDPKAFQAESDIFAKKLLVNNGVQQGLTPPEMFTRNPAMTADIKIGDTVIVSSSENIKDVKEFTASEIQIQFKPIIK